MEVYIARDKDNSLSLCSHKPVYDKFLDVWEAPNEFYNDDYAFHAYIDENLFPEVTFENSPKQAKITLL